jgi:hypothetical protein
VFGVVAHDDRVLWEFHTSGTRAMSSSQLEPNTKKARTEGSSVTAAVAAAPAAKVDDTNLVDKRATITALAEKLGKADELKLTEGGISDDDLEKLGTAVNVAVPADVAALLRHTAGGYLFDMWVPSAAEMAEHWGYNDAYPPVYAKLCAFPWGMIDYDFCWRVIEVVDGESVVWTVDGECDSIVRDGTLAQQLDRLIAGLEAGDEKPSCHARRGGGSDEGSGDDEGFGHDVWEALNERWGS